MLHFAIVQNTAAVMASFIKLDTEVVCYLMIMVRIIIDSLLLNRWLFGACTANVF